MGETNVGKKILGQVVKELCTFSNDETSPNPDTNLSSQCPTLPQYKNLVCALGYCSTGVVNVLGNCPGGMSRRWRCWGMSGKNVRIPSRNGV